MSLLYLLYYIPELGIVDDHAIIEVESYLLISNDMQAVVIFSALVNLLADAVQLLALGCGVRVSDVQALLRGGSVPSCNLRHS